MHGKPGNKVLNTTVTNTQQWRIQGGNGEASPPNPGKFAKYEEQPRPLPAIRIDSSRKL